MHIIYITFVFWLNVLVCDEYIHIQRYEHILYVIY